MRFDILYRFSTDFGATWTDISEQVDSLQTVISHNLCTNNFTSARDEASFVLPETALYNPDGTPTAKKALIDALLGNDPVLVHINERKPASKVMWDDKDVVWNGAHVMWSWSARRFTGYVDRSTTSLKSFPLPPNITVKVQDVSTLHLDDKVDTHVCYEGYTIKQIARGLLSLAGYNASDVSLSDADTNVMPEEDNITLEAFVIDKDNSQTYRQYLDTLLFEAGGYVIDFNEYGLPVLVHLQWDGDVTPVRAIDNPMNNDGVQMKSAYLKEDGVKLKWSTLQWGNGECIWQSDISQTAEDGIMVGKVVENHKYWPDNGELAPIYMEYDAKLLDSPYLTRASRRQNEDLSIIMAKNIKVRMDAMQGTNPFTSWVYVDPTAWPSGDTWEDKYGLTSNPQIYPTKAWYLLYNNSGADVNLTFFSIYGDVLYRSKINTMEIQGAKNPKEYDSTYIYSEEQAEKFVQFYWHFLQTSRYQFSWSEPNKDDILNSVVTVGVKGLSPQKALIVGRKSKWLNANTEIMTFTAVAVDTYAAVPMIPASILPSSTNPTVSTGTGAKTATFVTTPSFTLDEWEVFASSAQTWTITNDSIFNAGDVAMIQGVISDLENTPVMLYMDVLEVDHDNHTISGTGIRIKYIASDWDFTMSQYAAIRDDRHPNNFTDIVIKANITGHSGITPYWTVNGNHTHFTPGSAQYISGTDVTLRVWADENYDEITVTMYEDSSLTSPVTKKIAIENITSYDFNFGLISAAPLPTYTDPPTNTAVILEGDFFVAGATFSTAAWTVVTPGGSENPKTSGWYERTGTGTSSDPYIYKASNDTTVDSSKTYCTTTGTVYTKGVAYMYDGVSAWNAMTATADNASRMLEALSTILTNGTDVPSVSAMYAWFSNLVALNAVVDNLVARKLKVGLGNETTGFYLKIEDGDPPIIICKFNGSTLWEIDATTGKMYGNFALVRQYMPFQFDDSLDDSYPMECDFYIPSNAVIVSIKLSSKGKNYRAYSKGAATYGGTKTSNAIDPEWSWQRTSLGFSVTKITSASGFASWKTESAGDHKHTYDKATGTQASGFGTDGVHSHSLSLPFTDNGTTSGPSYSSSVANHTHGYKYPTGTSGTNDGAHSHGISTTSTDTSQTGSHQHNLPTGLVTDVEISNLNNG